MKPKLHIVNICLLLATVGLIILNIYKAISYKRWDRKHYSVSIGTPYGLPIDNYSHVITRKGEQVSFWLEKHGEGDWGYSGYVKDRLNFLSLPDSLLIRYHSFRERKIYEGDFKLPDHIIDSLYQFNAHYKESFDRYNKASVYGYKFIVGIGPLGEVTVWVNGKYTYQKEIARYTCTEVHEWRGRTIQELEEYVLDLNFSTKTDSLLKNHVPFDADVWKRKHEKFLYYIEVSPHSDVKNALIEFLNEERRVFDFTKKRRVLVESGMPFNFRLNDQKNGRYEETYRYRDTTLIKTFNKVPSLMSPTDTMVVYLRGNVKDKTLNINFSYTGEIYSFQKKR